MLVDQTGERIRRHFAQPRGSREPREYRFTRRPAVPRQEEGSGVHRCRSGPAQGVAVAARACHESLFFQRASIARREFAAPAPQPVLHGCVRCPRCEERYGLVQQGVFGRWGAAGHQEVTVERDGPGVDEVDQFRPRQSQGQLTQFHH
ncbi:hypothetical protein QFZ32_009238 [Streptomyces canus]|nr:hypothetical protein [Streptomyces canus]